MKGIMVEGEQISELIEKARQGDRGAYEELVLHCRDRLEAFIVRRIRPDLRPRLDQEALVVDTLGRAFESLSRFTGKDEDSWFAWLVGIAKKVVLKEIERLGRSQVLSIDPDIPSDRPPPSRILQREERFERLREAFARLSPDRREAIRLCRIEGLRIQEAAKRMGRSPGALKVLLWRALQELKELFGDTESLHLPDRRLESEGGVDGQ